MNFVNFKIKTARFNFKDYIKVYLKIGEKLSLK